MFSVSFGVADNILDERLQKLEKQRQNLEAKIQREAQNREINAQKQAKAREEREQKEARAKQEKERKQKQAQEKREAKQAQRIQLRETKRQQRKLFKNESTTLSGATNTSQESKQPIRSQTQPSIFTNPNDRNGWFVALTPKVEVAFIYANLYPIRFSFENNTYAGYGGTLEAGYLFGSGANRWRTYFSLGYSFARQNSVREYYTYASAANGYSSSLWDYTPTILDIHNMTHNVGIDWTPRFGNLPARIVLGLSNSFSYMAISERYDDHRNILVPDKPDNLDNNVWGGISYSLVTVPNGEVQNLVHIFFIGIGTRLGVIFDINEHFSIEIGSKISLAFSILRSNDRDTNFLAGVMPSFEQYLSLAYRF